MSEEQVIKTLDGDEQLFKIWMTFLQDNRCIIEDAANSRWVISDKGKSWLTTYSSG